MELRKMEKELFAVIANVKALSTRAKQRLLDMTASDSKLDAAVESRLEALKVFRHKQDTGMEIIMSNANPNAKSYSESEVLYLKTRFDEAKADYDRAHAEMDELEREFFKYNIPKRDSRPEPLERYLVRIREFMRIVWRETAEISRRKEYKSLLEWMDEIDRSTDRERRAVSREMRTVLVDIGVEISAFLVEYLWMISHCKEPEEVEERLGEVKAVIGSLGVEEGSVVIKCFVGVVELFRGAMREAIGKCSEEEEKDGNGSERDDDKLAKMFWMISVEILRLEVSFGNPDLPILLSCSTYNFMANHLTENVFKDKLAAIWDKTDETQTESEQQSIIDFFEEILKSGLKEVWQELDVNDKNGV